MKLILNIPSLIFITLLLINLIYLPVIKSQSTDEEIDDAVLTINQKKEKLNACILLAQKRHKLDSVN